VYQHCWVANCLGLWTHRSAGRWPQLQESEIAELEQRLATAQSRVAELEQASSAAEQRAEQLLGQGRKADELVRLHLWPGVQCTRGVRADPATVRCYWAWRWQVAQLRAQLESKTAEATRAFERLLELEAEVTSTKQAREAAEREVQAREHAVEALQQQVADAEKVRAFST